jgi:hypothetical protein
MQKSSSPASISCVASVLDQHTVSCLYNTWGAVELTDTASRLSRAEISQFNLGADMDSVLGAKPGHEVLGLLAKRFLHVLAWPENVVVEDQGHTGVESVTCLA